MQPIVIISLISTEINICLSDEFPTPLCVLVTDDWIFSGAGIRVVAIEAWECIWLHMTDQLHPLLPACPHSQMVSAKGERKSEYGFKHIKLFPPAPAT